MVRMFAIAAAVVVSVGLATTWVLTRNASEDAFAQCRATKIAGGEGSIGGPFELVTAEGATVTDKDVITEPSLIYFGYTFCPDVCPLDNARNAAAVDLLAERGMSATPIFITIDPERDTPEIVGDYAELFHEKMIGLTGSLDQTDAASKAFKTYYKKQPAEDDYYLVDHSVFTYLVLPEVGFVEFFRRDNTAEELADAAACFIGKA